MAEEAKRVTIEEAKRLLGLSASELAQLIVNEKIPSPVLDQERNVSVIDLPAGWECLAHNAVRKSKEGPNPATEPKKKPEAYTIIAAATELRISSSTVFSLIRTGKLVRAQSPGIQVRITAESVAALKAAKAAEENRFATPVQKYELDPWRSRG